MGEDIVTVVIPPKGNRKIKRMMDGLYFESQQEAIRYLRGMLVDENDISKCEFIETRNVPRESEEEIL